MGGSNLMYNTKTPSFHNDDAGYNEHSFKPNFKTNILGTNNNSNNPDFRTIDYMLLNGQQGASLQSAINYESLKKVFPFLLTENSNNMSNLNYEGKLTMPPVMPSKPSRTAAAKKKLKKLKKGKTGKGGAGKKSAMNSRNTSFGLKEISKNVKKIVKSLKKTTYKQISDIIINEINETHTDCKDEKNIRRRIYDSLNVMKAMKLFKKDKHEKNILWNGDKIRELYQPTNSSNFPFNSERTRTYLNKLSNDELRIQLVKIFY
jgi:hypothetical protein